MIDIVTVYHNKYNYCEAISLQESLKTIEPSATYYLMSNMVDNVGFAKRCNEGASLGSNEVIGFLNPDTVVAGPFVDTVCATLNSDSVWVTGCDFGKSPSEKQAWGCSDWVCGAAFFMRREKFEMVGGFDERYVWGWEETDLIRRVQALGGRASAIELPLFHSSPPSNTQDAAYKNRHFNNGAKIFYKKWNGR